MLTLKDISYIHTNGDILMDHLNLSLTLNTKSALIGRNGSGKSMLLQLIAGHRSPASGMVERSALPYYIPQKTESLLNFTVAQALGIEEKIKALQAILKGETDEHLFSVLDDDWQLDERCQAAFAYWALDHVKLEQEMKTLSGGERTKILLAGIQIHQPEFVLLDEPTNHLDRHSREMVYAYIRDTSHTVLVVTHDVELLNRVTTIYEMSNHRIYAYGGNYDFYRDQKELALTALKHDVQEQQKSLRKLKRKEQDVQERRQRLDARGKSKQQKSGVPKIMMNTLRNQAESSTARLKDVHAVKIEDGKSSLQTLRNKLPELDQIKLELKYNKSLHNKKLIDVKEVNFRYGHRWLWSKSLTFSVFNGVRIQLRGSNGSGKTTAIKLMLGLLSTENGIVTRVPFRYLYIDQDYSLLQDEVSVYEQAQVFNKLLLPEHEVKIRLNRFLFPKDRWDQRCGSLSGGERMRLLLCCLTIQEQAPDLMVLDEPTNNLDLQNAQILSKAIRDYKGTLLVVSHDQNFVKNIGISEMIDFDSYKTH